MNGILPVAAGFALDVALKATVLFAITALAVAALDRSGAAARHFAGMAGLIGAIAIPFLTLALPRVDLPLFPSLLPRAESAVRPFEPAGGWEKSPRQADETSFLRSEKPESTGVPAPAASRNAGPVTAKGIAWLPLALGAWTLGLLLAGSRLAIGVARVRHLRRDAARIRDEDWTLDVESLAGHLALHRQVQLYESARVPVAITSGLLRPFLLLCRQARLWAVERRRVVLLHELAHVKRNDWIWVLAAEAALAIYWWHPLAWLLVRQVRRDGEKACDDLVLAAGTKPSVYAGHLLGIFRSLASAAHPVAPAVASARPSHFEGRLRSILDPSAPRRDLAKGRATVSAAFLMASAAGIAVVSPWIPTCSSEAVHRPAAAVSAARTATGAGSPLPTISSCPKERAKTAGAVRTAAEPPAEGKNPHDSPRDSKDPAPGRTLPAVLTPLQALPKLAGAFVRASQEFTHAGNRDGSEWYSRAMDLHHRGRYDEAIAAFEKAIEAGYREDVASYNIACGYALKGDRDKAFEWLRKAEEEGFDVASHARHDDDLVSLRSDPRWKAIREEADKHPSARQEHEAAAAVKRYERIASGSSKNGEAYFRSGKELLNAGRYDLSARAFQAASDHGYRVGTSLYNEACALSRGGQTRAALDLLEKALDAGFDQPDMFEKDDDLDNVRGDPRFARIAREARELSLPGYGIGNVFERSSDRRSKWRDAARRFEEYARANPGKGRAWFNLGFASLAGDRPEAAVEAFGKALELGYRRPTTLYNLACTYSRLDKPDQAFDYLFKALDSGFDAVGMLRSDEDLDNLRGDPRFRKALEIARARAKADD